MDASFMYDVLRTSRTARRRDRPTRSSTSPPHLRSRAAGPSPCSALVGSGPAPGAGRCRDGCGRWASAAGLRLWASPCGCFEDSRVLCAHFYVAVRGHIALLVPRRGQVPHNERCRQLDVMRIQAIACDEHQLPSAVQPGPSRSAAAVSSSVVATEAAPWERRRIRRRLRSSGTRSPRTRAASMMPAALSSVAAKMAVGGSARSSRSPPPVTPA